METLSALLHGPLCREFTGHRWIPRTKASGAELWCFLWSVPEQGVEQTIETLVILDAIVRIMTPLYWMITLDWQYNKRFAFEFVMEWYSTKITIIIITITMIIIITMRMITIIVRMKIIISDSKSNNDTTPGDNYNDNDNDNNKKTITIMIMITFMRRKRRRRKITIELCRFYLSAISQHETLSQWNITIIMVNMHHYKRRQCAWS